MGLTSKTGLTASPTKKIARHVTTQTIQLRAIARPAPFILKRFAGLYNPYPYGCSLLCNHPTDKDAKEILQKAKDNWGTEGRNLLLAEEVEAIRETLKLISTNEQTQNLTVPQVESVPEELFRRYTETDSRPLTPAPTLASAATRASGSRRCITPDLVPTNHIREKTLLVLDLRRSHSQETLSYYGSSSIQEPPLIRIQHVHTRAESLEEKATEEVQTITKSLSTPAIFKRPRSGVKSEEVKENAEVTSEEKDEEQEVEEEEFVKRRGKRRRKRGRDSSRGPPGFQPSLDPETQMATIGLDSHNPSARPSLVPGGSLVVDTGDASEKKKGVIKPSKSLDIDSYLDVEILKQLRRELNEEIVDNELNINRRKALEEALKTVTKDRTMCDELVNIQKELQVPPINSNLWMSLPRAFSRSSARFELPMDSRTLKTMTPLDYVRENVSISSPRKLLYNCIFNKFKMETETDGEYERKLSGTDLPKCLDLLMGKPLSEKQYANFRRLLGWKESDIFDFKTCCGIFALCERLLAPEFYPQLPDRKTDPCHEIELADFEVLARKIHRQEVDERLLEILIGIKTL